MKPPVTYSHPKSVIVMIHMTGGRTYGSIRMVLPMEEWRQNPAVRSGVEKRRDSVPCPPPLSNPYGQVWEHASVLIRILKLSVYKKCESINPLMEPWEASMTGTPAGIVMDSRFLRYGKEKESRSGSGSTTPFGYVRGTLRWKKKLLFTHG